MPQHFSEYLSESNFLKQQFFDISLMAAFKSILIVGKNHAHTLSKLPPAILQISAKLLHGYPIASLVQQH